MPIFDFVNIFYADREGVTNNSHLALCSQGTPAKGGGLVSVTTSKVIGLNDVDL